MMKIGEFELDPERYELRRDGAPVHVEPLVFDLIRYLATSGGRVVSRDDIVAAVWDGRFVSDATISGAIKSARRALGDSGAAQTMIETVRGRGFRFCGMVEGPPATAEPRSAPARLPALAVLPFQTFGGGAELTAIAHGLSENLTTVLTRIPLLSVASRMAAFALGAQPVAPEEVRSRLDVDLMVEGSVQRTGERFRVNVQLIRTDNARHLWAQVFEVPTGPDALPELVEAVTARLEPQIVRALPQIIGLSEGEVGPRQLTLQAVVLLSIRGWHSDTFTQATALLRQAVAGEPDFALSHAYLALIHSLGQRVGLLRTGPEDVAAAIAAADRALELDPMDSDVLGLAGCALADVKQTSRAVPILRQAVTLNPHNAQARTALGSALMLDGDMAEAIGHLEAGIRISPADSRRAIWGAVLSLALLMTGDAEGARKAGHTAWEADTRSYLPLVVLTAAELALGDEAGAARAARDCRRCKPDITEAEVACIVGPELGAAVIGQIGAASAA